MCDNKEKCVPQAPNGLGGRNFSIDIFFNKQITLAANNAHAEAADIEKSSALYNSQAICRHINSKLHKTDLVSSTPTHTGARVPWRSPQNS